MASGTPQNGHSRNQDLVGANVAVNANQPSSLCKGRNLPARQERLAQHRDRGGHGEGASARPDPR
jgi:hypothetical protein